jgi:hypothetical protein
MPRPALFPAPLPSGVFGRIPPKLGDRIGGGSYPSGAGASCFLENFVPPAPFSVTREMKKKVSVSLVWAIAEAVCGEWESSVPSPRAFPRLAGTRWFQSGWCPTGTP